MSYVERALYDYVKKTLTEGLQVLFSRRFVLFTLLMFFSGGLTIGLVILVGQGAIGFSDLRTAFLLLTATSMGFIVAGLLAKRLLSTIWRFLLLLIVLIVVGGLGIVSVAIRLPDEIPKFYLEIYPLICFFAWTLLMPIAGFGFARGLFYNKVIGSALFLGKPVDDHRAIFSVVFAFFALLGIITGLFLITRKEILVILAGVSVVVLSLLIFFTSIGKIFKNDAFNSALSLFFATSALPTMIMLSFSSEITTVTLFNYALLTFSLIYTAQGQARRASPQARMTEQDLRAALVKEKQNQKLSDDPYGISRLLRFIGSEGIVLIFLGTFLGYMSLQVQLLWDNSSSVSLGQLNRSFENLFPDTSIGQTYQVFGTLFISLIIGIVMITYVLLPNVRTYFTADLYRFAWLPTYDEAKAYFAKIQTGEITIKDVSLDAMKALGGAAVKQARLAGASFLGRLLGRRSRESK